MEQYNVTGMSCAACSARVEKAVSHVPGVTRPRRHILFGQPADQLHGRRGNRLPGGDHRGGGSGRIRRVRKGGRTRNRQNRRHVHCRSGGFTERPGNAENETPAHRVSVFPHSPYVFFNGPYDVGLAGPFIPGRKPCGHGADPAPSDDHCHGDQPEVLHQRV